MTDEEKEALEILKSFEPDDLVECAIYLQALEKITNLIEKQSKEIEELKTDRDKFKKALGKRITYCNELEKDLFENCSNYVVSKDKIKAKIEEINKEMLNEENSLELFYRKKYCKEVLQSLLEKE